MTELAAATLLTGLVSVPPITVALAVIDPSVTSIALAVIAAAVVIIPLWFKYKTDSMNAKIKEQDEQIKEVIVTTNGMKTALVTATGEAKRAEGVLEGVAMAESKAATTAAAKAEGAAAESAKKLP